MAKTFSELQALALQIRDEILEKKNTAPRVGAALLDMIDNTIQNITDINQKLSVFEHACSGFKRVQSESQLPVTPSQDEKAVGYLVGKNLYLYVEEGGNAVSGRYFNVGDITGPQGEPGPQGLVGPVGPKGEQGNSGVTGPTDNIEVVNNLDGGESTPERIKVLAAEQGKVLNGKLYELEGNIGISFFKEVPFTKKGNTIINSGGSFSSYGGGRSTDYIEVGEMKSVSIHNLISETSSAVAVAFYDDGKSFISTIPYHTTNKLLSPILAIFPSNCKYFAVSKQSSSNLDEIKIYTNISANDIESIKTKADIGSVFGAQKAEADGSDTKLIFNNTFKEGDIIHLVNVKAAANTYWGLKGFSNGVWTTISSRMFNGSPVTKDVVIPQGTEKYEKIAIETEGQLLLSGYGYTITTLTLQDIEKINDIATYTDQLKELPIIQQDVLLSSDNLINPMIVQLLSNGWWVSDYIQVDEGDTYYSNASLGFFTYNESKADVTSTSPFVSGSPIPSGVSFVRAKIGASGNTPNEESAINKSNNLWLSKNNEAAKYAKKFNTYLINIVDSVSRDTLEKLMPHVGKGLFCVGDSYTMQGSYFPALLAVTGLNKIGDTGGDGNGQPYTIFAKNIIKYKEQILQCKFVTILGGTNDYGHGGGKLGTINDCIKDEYAELKVPILKLNEEGYYVKDDSVDTTYKVLTEEDINAGQTPKSVYAAIMTCVNIIHGWDKTITVVLCSQPERLPYGSQSCNPPLLRNGMNMDLLAKAMREIHEMFGVPYYDFHSNGWTIDQVEIYMNDGTLHPNSLGGEKIGRGLGMYINSI